MRVWKLNDRDTVAAASAEDATRWYSEHVGNVDAIAECSFGTVVSVSRLFSRLTPTMVGPSKWRFAQSREHGPNSKENTPPRTALESTMSNELTVDEMIDHVLNWFAGARPGDSFTPRTPVELQTGRDNAAYAALVPNLPHIKKMADNGWLQMNGRYATLTPAGKAEMDRRGFVVGD